MLEKAIFNEDVINARHDWGTRYLEWTSKAFTLDRYTAAVVVVAMVLVVLGRLLKLNGSFST